ncbi:MAG: glycoside hydrolase family 11 protein [Fibromonadaceae bacterium]|nr:glycoside hydrolase family 11 protein [Fibromonadaceae bacterium]
MKKVAIALCLAITFTVSVFAQNPCDQTTKLTGGTTYNGTKGATVLYGSGDDAIGVEAWTEAGGNATKLTWYGQNQGGGSAFRAEWTNSTDYLGRVGYQWGTNGKKWSNLGDLCVDYNYTRSANGSGGSYSYIGIYGWTISSSTSAEYYIVEDWFGNGQQGANNLGSGCNTHGNITVDGKQYQVITCRRPQGSGCVSCNNQAFYQVFSVRQGMANNNNKCGTISIKKHFEEWTKISAVSQYIYDKTYESKFLVEAQGGTGWFEASWMKFSRTGACGGTSTTPSSSSAAPSSSSRAASSSSVAASSSSRANSSSSAAGSSVTLSCTGLQASVEKGGTIATPTLTCSNGSQATNINWTGRPQSNGSWSVTTNTNTTSYTIGATATCGTASNLTASCGTVAVGAASSSSNASGTSSSSVAAVSSSSSDDATPILNSQLSTLNSQPITYFSLKGEPLGNAKPQKAGIYIVKQGSSVQKVAVR